MDSPLPTLDPLAEIRPTVAALPESGIVELVNYGREKEGLIPLWVGEGDLPTPEFIRKAATEALEAGQTRYTYQRGVPPLRQAIADYLARTYGAEVPTDNITVTVGGMQAILVTMQMMIDPGDEVVAVSPVWPNIFSAVRICGGRDVQVPLSLDDTRGWLCDLDRLFDACGPKTKAIFVNSPGNPTGWTLTREEMVAIRDFARHRGIWIVADEVYNRVTFELDKAPSFLEIMSPEERLIAVNTLSKNWAMTGWRVGWAVAPRALGPVYENLIQFNTSGVATFLQYGAAAALDQGDGFIQQMRRATRAGTSSATRWRR
jgi:aspartate/methionine/tyrosine aminotransferase